MNEKALDPRSPDELIDELIDEAELRAALLPLRPGRERFEAGIRQRIEQAEASLLQNEGLDETTPVDSAWLKVAAAVIPFPLLGKTSAGSLVQLGGFSLAEKMIILTALPATGLLLMVTATLWAIIKIRRAQRRQPSGDTDVLVLQQVTASWWRRFGFLVFGMCGVMLLLTWFQHAVPVFVVFLISGITMLSLITRLGREGLVDRNALAATLCPSLFILVQLTYLAAMLDQGYRLLDPMLIPAVLLLGGFVIMLLCDFPKEVPIGNRGAKWFFGILVILLSACFSSSLWNPVSTRALRNYVESFDRARYSSASWQRWQVPAQWLRDLKVPVDLSKPYALLQAELNQDEQNVSILCTAIEADLYQPQDLDRVRDFSGLKTLVFDPWYRKRPFVSIDTSTRFLVHASVLLGELSESERDFLGERLVATMQSLSTNFQGSLLEEQLAITKLASLIGRPLDIGAHRAFVHHTLDSHQCLANQWSNRLGGFGMRASFSDSDEQVTAAAIELMQLYGVPNDLRIDALRSYLRPSFHDQWFPSRGGSYVRAASLQRLQSLPDVQPLTGWDYVRQEQNLMMAVLFTIVCVFATLGAPKLRDS